MSHLKALIHDVKHVLFSISEDRKVFRSDLLVEMAVLRLKLRKPKKFNS